ncbi:hypothetical protein T440DRAFT_260819 [Plenodomus tracheiphilus IPT5]|uniref:Uncharacterized protein n=1 Tax=Plenodomus tracheiphilus IPT5 TaxID=1408161 RepID=A0A6A7AS81_9PLEO|nr:hypothetical protein T440DRAFT_260819 [Plenodomus tracheiphilus IPT5]
MTYQLYGIIISKEPSSDYTGNMLYFQNLFKHIINNIETPFSHDPLSVEIPGKALDSLANYHPSPIDVDKLSFPRSWDPGIVQLDLLSTASSLNHSFDMSMVVLMFAATLIFGLVLAYILEALFV